MAEKSLQLNVKTALILKLAESCCLYKPLNKGKAPCRAPVTLWTHARLTLKYQNLMFGAINNYVIFRDCARRGPLQGSKLPSP